jgi:pyocin large subunit-like protein
VAKTILASSAPTTADQGIVRIYDPGTNTFGAYNLQDGTTLTFYKPSSDSYWARNAPRWGKSSSEMTPAERRALMGRLRGAPRGFGEED